MNLRTQLKRMLPVLIVLGIFVATVVIAKLVRGRPFYLW
jgi:hypothetical protein